MCSGSLSSTPNSCGAQRESAVGAKGFALYDITQVYHTAPDRVCTRHVVDKAMTHHGHLKRTTLAGAVVQHRQARHHNASCAQCQQLLVNDLQQTCHVNSSVFACRLLLWSLRVIVTCRVPGVGAESGLLWWLL